LTGRIDIHSHLIPGVDDGCGTVAESIECARRMVAAGYTHSFCTPHYWPNLQTSAKTVTRWVAALQAELDRARVPLKLYPGGEINLRPGLDQTDPEELVSYHMARKFALVDFWADEMPAHFEPQIKWLQSMGMTVILAHPERVKAIQADPIRLADYFAELGLLLQGNLQCLSDAPTAPTRVTMERYLAEGRYTFLGSDLHNVRTLDVRLEGLKRAIELVGEAKVDEMTGTNPRMLLPGS
jgi:protein-tyrosine phosphatase